MAEVLSGALSKRNLDALRKMHEDAKGTLMLALDCDEKGENAEAIQLYQQTAATIDQAMDLRFTEQDMCVFSESVAHSYAGRRAIADRVRVRLSEHDAASTNASLAD